MPVVTTLTLSDTERPIVARALRMSLWRGYVEYSPVECVRALAGLAEPLPLTVPGVHALTQVMAWTNSATQAKRWSKDELRHTQAVRKRLEARDGETVLTPEGDEVMSLW